MHSIRLPAVYLQIPRRLRVFGSELSLLKLLVGSMLELQSVEIGSRVLPSHKSFPNIPDISRSRDLNTPEKIFENSIITLPEKLTVLYCKVDTRST